MKRSKKNYNSVLLEVEKPLRDRTILYNKLGKNIIPRKYHISSTQFESLKNIWEKDISNVSISIKKKASNKFFNPYRSNGIYYSQIKALFLLGSNEWHTYVEIKNKMKDILILKYNRHGKNLWESFENKEPRSSAILVKDTYGKIVDNFKILQRLGGINPYGYKLKQLCSCIDIKRDKDGLYYFRLNTSFENEDLVKPLYDIKDYENNKALDLKNRGI
jgi:hypothetical protein